MLEDKRHGTGKEPEENTKKDDVVDASSPGEKRVRRFLFGPDTQDEDTHRFLDMILGPRPGDQSEQKGEQENK